MTRTRDDRTRRRRGRRAVAAAAVVALLGGGAAVATLADDDDRDARWPEGLVVVPLDGAEATAVDGLAPDDVHGVIGGATLVTVRTPEGIEVLDLTGEVLATHRLGDGWGSPLPPVAWGDVALLRTSKDDDESQLWALSVETGERLWVVDDTRADGRPVPIDDETLAVATGEEVIVLDRTGAVRARSEPLDIGSGPPAVPLDGGVVVVGDDEAVQVAPDGAIVRRVRIPACASASGVIDGDLLLGIDGGCAAGADELVRVDWPSGEEAWRTEIPHSAAGDLAVVDGSVVLIDPHRPEAAVDGIRGDVLWARDDVRATADGLVFTVTSDGDDASLQPVDPVTAEPDGVAVDLPSATPLTVTRHVALLIA